ncbi:MAG: apolipoprotein N-acyltransferase, partial [Chlorobi bacterium]|nr:apolipoprotein N-acyltransferase [Chlorobiota bacterium]
MKIKKMTLKKSLLFALFSGLLITLAFPPMTGNLLIFVGFVPLLFALEERNYHKPFLTMFIAMFVFHYGANWWISSWQENTDPYLFISGFAVGLGNPMMLLIPMYIFLMLRKKIGRDKSWALFPFIWTAYEWFHGLGDFSYPWLTIGNTQIFNTYWAQAADIFGAWGLSFMIISINVLVLKLIYIMKEKSPEVKGWKASLRLPKVRRYALGIILLFLIPNIYGLIKVSQFDHYDLLKENKSIRVALVQPNIDPWNKWAKISPDDQITLHQQIYDSLTAAVGHIDLAIWSETSIGFIDKRFNSRHDMYPLIDNINRNESSLLAGFIDVHFYKKTDDIPRTARYLPGDSSQRYDNFNSALLVNPDKFESSRPQLHHKSRLTPFAERLPFADYLIFAKEWFEWGVGISGWQKGKVQQPLMIRRANDSVLIGSIICIESIYSDCVSEFVRNGAEVLT